MVGKHRTPVRPLSTGHADIAYPGELLVNPSTGDIIYVNDEMIQISHKKPGTLTVKQGTTTVLNTTDLSNNITLNIPEFPDAILPTGLTWTAGTTDGPIGKLALSNSTTVSFAAIPSASATASGVITTGAQTIAGTKTFSSTITGSISGNAGTATKLQNARTITVNLESTSGASFDGSANVTPGVAGVLPIANGGTGAATAAEALTSLGAAAASHNHSTANITSGTLAVARGGTGVTTNPSMLVNLASTTAASVFAASPRPGITGTLPIANGGTGSTTAEDARTALGITPANIGAAASSHNHSASNITSGTLGVARGGTGVTSNPSMLVNLASTTAASVFATSPRPGVTGTLPIANGGTGSATAADARTALGITPANIGAAASNHTHTSDDITNLTDLNYYPTAWAWTAGTTAGPTAKLTGTGMSAVSVAAIPAASATASGIITTGTQTIAGAKTFSSTITGSVSGNAGTATKLQTARTITVNLASVTGASFDGSVNVTPGVTGVLPIANGGTGADTAAEALTALGAAAASHSHSAANITSGTLAIARGGTGVTANPSMLVNLASTSAASVFATSPRPGVTGTLPIANGGTGATTAAAARTALGAAASSHTHTSDDITDLTDLNYYPTAWAWTAGTTAGPTAKITGTGMSAVSVAAIPSASSSASGIMTTGTQTIAGAKTFSTSVSTPKLTVSTAGNTSGVSKVYDTSIATGWSGSSAPYTKAVTVSGILATDRPVIDFRPSGTYSTDKTAEEAFLNIYRAVTAANKITFYAHEKPTVAIPIQVKVVR